MRFRGSSGRSAGTSCDPSPGVPPNTEPESILEGVPSPLGETDLEPVGVDVDAKREETDALDARYGNVDIEDAIDCVSVEPLIFGSLNEEGPVGGSGGSKGEALLEGVMKTNEGSSTGIKTDCFAAQSLGASTAT